MLGDVDQHQADQDLVGVEAVAQQRDDRRPRPCRRARRRPAPAATIQRAACPWSACIATPLGGDRADDELAFGADVPDVGAKADREAERDQQQRRRLHRQLGQRVGALHRLDEEHLQPAQRVLAEQQRTARCRSRTVIAEREQRRRDRHRRDGCGRASSRSMRRPPAPCAARPTGRSSTRRSARPSASRVGDARRDAARARSRPGGRRSRTARRAPR